MMTERESATMFWNKIFNERLILGLSRPGTGFSVLFHGAVLILAALPSLLHPPAPPEPYREPPLVLFQFSQASPCDEPDADLTPAEPSEEPPLPPWEARESRETFEPVASAPEAIEERIIPLPTWKPVMARVLPRTPPTEPSPPTKPVVDRAPPPLRPVVPGTVPRRQTPAGFVTASKIPGSCPKPRYPRAAVRRKLEGRVVLLVRIDREGRPIEIMIAESSGRTMFDRAAERAVRKWRFTPARRDGVPVEDTVRVPIRFSLTGR
ncbi:MAG TPA: energy transducer TonB [Planctomycetes bacterium]|nr:energy transducer TonB [Planctomycetota bacterium]